MDYKVSNYNIYFPYEDGTYLFFNTLTNALAVIEEKNYLAFKEFEERGYKLEKDFLEQLSYCGFIIEKDFDELLFIRRKMLEQRYSKDTLALTIAPTMKCNFACDYCFETGVRDGKMDEKTIKKIIKFVDERLLPGGELVICWMGGEPLLELDVMEVLSKAFINMCKSKGARYKPILVTNGYLLTEDIARRLAKIGIISAQITLDGIEEDHNKKRPLKNGGPTYKRIIENIFSILNIFQGVVIRVNLDRENVQNAHYILDLFDKPDIKDRVNIEFALVNDVTGELQNKCFEKREFREIQLKLEELKIIRGFKMRKFPYRNFNSCGATVLNHYVVDPKGRLFNCWADYGYYERAIGNIHEKPSRLEQQKESKCLTFDPTRLKQCKDCKLLPLCMGGCYWKRTFKDPQCSVFEDQIEKIIKLIVQNKLYCELN